LRYVSCGAYNGGMETHREFHYSVEDVAVRFYSPEDGRGKWHAKRVVSGVADCGAPVILGNDLIEATKGDLSAKKHHPIICGRCARLNGVGYTGGRVA